jgi:hypothetical protein
VIQVKMGKLNLAKGGSPLWPFQLDDPLLPFAQIDG